MNVFIINRTFPCHVFIRRIPNSLRIKSAVIAFQSSFIHESTKLNDSDYGMSLRKTRIYEHARGNDCDIYSINILMIFRNHPRISRLIYHLYRLSSLHSKMLYLCSVVSMKFRPFSKSAKRTGSRPCSRAGPGGGRAPVCFLLTFWIRMRILSCEIESKTPRNGLPGVAHCC